MKNILNEVLSDIIFHKTYLEYALDIIKTDTFKMATNAGTKSDQKGNRPYYASFARSKRSAYFSMSTGTVVLTIDGKKLSQNYKGGAVDYWQWHKKDLSQQSPQDRMQMLQGTEMEDRLFSDKPTIPNFTKYIMKVDILVKPEYEKYISFTMAGMERSRGASPEDIEKMRGKLDYSKIKDKDLSDLRKLILECKKKNIEVNVFSEESKMKFGGDPSNQAANNKYYRSQLDTQSNSHKLGLKVPMDKKYDRSDKGRDRPWRRYDDDDKVPTILRVYYGNASTEDYSRARWFSDPKSYRFADAVASIGADIHNNRSNMEDRDVRQLLQLMQKEKISTVGEFIEKIIFPKAMSKMSNESLRIKIYRRVERLLEFLRDREDMPQVATDDLQPAVDMLKAAGVDITIVDRSPYGLKPPQKQMNGAAIKKLVDRYKDKPMSDIKPIVISNDGYIVDGHHRWGALLILNREHDNFPFIQIGLPRDQAIEAFNKVAEKFE